MNIVTLPKNNVNEITFNKLNLNQKRMLSKLQDFQAPYLEEKLIDEGKFESSLDFQIAFTEFKKYVFLTQLTDGGIGMSSTTVDDVWHQFILFTTQYHKFCNNFLGKYLHHLPRSSYFPVKSIGRKNFYKLYQNIFGEVHPIWINSQQDMLSDDCGSDGCGQDACTNDCSNES